MTSLHAINDVRTQLEDIINQSLKIMRTADAETRFQHRTTARTLIRIANKLSIVTHGIVDKVDDATNAAAVGKDASITLRHTHKYSSYIPEVDYDEMMYMLRKRLQYLVRYELDMARKWAIDLGLPSHMSECMQAIDNYMMFAEKLNLLTEYDINHTRAVQNACRKGNFSLNTIKYNLRGI